MNSTPPSEKSPARPPFRAERARVETSPPEALIELDRGLFERAYPAEPFLVRHRLVGHPSFEPRRLIELAGRLPESSIEYNAGDVPVSVDPKRTPRNGLSAKETIRRIRDCRSWMVLKNVEQDPVYAELLKTCLEEISRTSGDRGPEMRDEQGFLFLSSPGAVTPFHMDPEHNFLLQIEGCKSVSIFDPSDRDVLPAAELERFFTGGHRNLKFDEGYQDKARVFRLEPGTGLHFPVTAPHWVRNGDDVSISFSITFRSPYSERREKIFKMNAMLRKLRWKPVEPGRSSWPDAVKLGGFELLRRSKGILSRVAGA